MSSPSAFAHTILCVLPILYSVCWPEPLDCSVVYSNVRALSSTLVQLR